MSKLVKRMGPLGLYALARRLCRKKPRILMYHRFSEVPKENFASAEVFRNQVEHISRYYEPMTLRDLTKALYEEGRVPDHAVVLTIDDGYRDFYDIAYPILREYSVPATFFVTTGFINGDLWLWHDQVKWLLNQTEYVEERFSVGPITIEAGWFSEVSRRFYWKYLNDYFLSIDDVEKHQQIKLLSEGLGQQIPEIAPEGYDACTWAQLKEMESHGIEIGGHTVSHPSLGRVSNEVAWNEIFGAMEALEGNLGVKARSFCYPNGQPLDYTEDVVQFVKDAGFVCATVAYPGREGVQRRYAMNRHVAGDGAFQFGKAVSGVVDIGSRLGRVRVA